MRRYHTPLEAAFVVTKYQAPDCKVVEVPDDNGPDPCTKLSLALGDSVMTAPAGFA